MRKTAYAIGYCLALLCGLLPCAGAQKSQQEPVRVYGGRIRVTPHELRQRGRDLYVKLSVDTRSGSVRSNESVRLTPVLVAPNGRTLRLVPMQINGLGEQKAYDRSLLLTGKRSGRYTDNMSVVRSGDHIDYRQKVHYRAWMADARLNIVEEVSGCGSAWYEEGTEGLFDSLSLQRQVAPYVPDLHYSFLLPERRSGAEPGEELREELLKRTEEGRPSDLSLDEMYQLALTYPQGSAAFCDLLQSAARAFAGDPAANINAASAALVRGDLTEAANFLRLVQGEIPEYDNVAGCLELLRGNYRSAEALLRHAMKMGVAEAEHNLHELERKRENAEAAAAVRPARHRRK